MSWCLATARDSSIRWKTYKVEVLDHDSVGHVSYGGNNDATLKTFVDLYMIARAKKVYRIDAPELYAWSGFAVTGAMIGGIDFFTERV